MTREEIRARIEEIGIIPAIRVSSADDALFAAEAVSESAIPIVEVTMTVPGAVEVIRQLTSHHPGRSGGRRHIVSMWKRRAAAWMPERPS
jgi:2-dehydro-3-deoxyphosphogluconate aldolase / (4S)-4-hydroxy-2-oxoglutarate aldolase